MFLLSVVCSCLTCAQVDTSGVSRSLEFDDHEAVLISTWVRTGVWLQVRCVMCRIITADTHTHAHTHAHTHIHTHKYIETHKHRDAHTHTNTHTHKRIEAHTCRHTHTVSVAHTSVRTRYQVLYY